MVQLLTNPEPFYQFPVALGIGILMRFGVPGPPPENNQAKMAIERITAMVKMS